MIYNGVCDMLKILKYGFSVLWFIGGITGISINAAHYSCLDWLIILSVLFIPILVLFKTTKKESSKTLKNDNEKNYDISIKNLHNSNSEHKNTIFIDNTHFLNLPDDVLSLLYIKGGHFSNYKESLENEPSLIDLSLPIETQITKEDSEKDIGNYPSYGGLSPKGRYIYLKWLQNIEDSIPIGYVFIFYYGLERQLLYGKFNQAFNMIIRLRKYHINGSFASYSGDALLISSLYHKKYDKLQKINTNELDGKICILITFLSNQLKLRT